MESDNAIFQGLKSFGKGKCFKVVMKNFQFLLGKILTSHMEYSFICNLSYRLSNRSRKKNARESVIISTLIFERIERM